MRPLRNETSIRIATTAWAQLGVVPSDVFARMKSHLQNLVAGFETLPVQELGDAGKLYFTVDDFVAMYAIDRQSRTVTLLEVARRLPEVR